MNVLLAQCSETPYMALPCLMLCTDLRMDLNITLAKTCCRNHICPQWPHLYVHNHNTYYSGNTPVVHAVLAVWLGPCRPYRMLTAPAAMLARIFGTKKGFMRRSLPCQTAANFGKVYIACQAVLPQQLTEPYSQQFGH